MRHTHAKKLLALLLAVILIVGALPLGAGAYSPGAVGQTNLLGEGSSHSAVVDKNGDLWVWGSNDSRQTGLSKTTMTPTKLISGIASVSAGANHTMVIKKDGTLWGWGYNHNGELGNGGKSDSTNQFASKCQSKPVKVMSDVSSVSAGMWHTAIIKTDGSLWMCGSNGYGELGTGKASKDAVKTPVKVMENVSVVCAGEQATAIVKKDGSLWVCGNNLMGRLGAGTVDEVTTPIKILDNVKSVSLGSGAGAAVKTDGSLWAWGNNRRGMVGNGGKGETYPGYGSDPSFVLKPEKITDDVASVSVSSSHVVAVKKDGTLWAWGSNHYGQLGNGWKGNQTADKDYYDDNLHSGKAIWQDVPMQVMESVSLISTGNYKTIAVKADGSVWTCGYNTSGELGLGNNTNQSTFQKIPGLTVSTGSAPVTPVEPAKPTVAGFKDVFEGDYYADAVKWAVESGITSGTDKTHFSPNASCTRAQFVTFLWRAAGKPSAGGENPFADVKESDYFYSAVLWASQNGITSGTSETKFSPGAAVNRGQAVTFLYRYAGKPAVGESNPFGDVSAEDYYHDAVLWAAEKNVTSGTSADAFSPTKRCLRGQTVTFLYRYQSA